MFERFRHFLEMIRFSHTIFALPFALLAAVMAWCARPAVPFRWQDLLGILLCMVSARSVAMAFNRLVDCKLDAKNPRTAKRHLPAGILSAKSVIGFALLFSLAFVGATLLFLPNRLPLYLSLPVLLFLCGYSYTKRFTSLAHFWLGAALMLAPVSVWIAIRGKIVLSQPGDLLPAILLGSAVLLWVAGFDMIYACQDAEFDKESGLRSIPSRLGVRGALRLAACCHAGMIGLLAWLPLEYDLLGTLYWIGVGVIAVLLIYEHAIVRPHDLTRVNTAFFHLNAIISMGLFVVASIDLLV